MLLLDKIYFFQNKLGLHEINFINIIKYIIIDDPLIKFRLKNFMNKIISFGFSKSVYIVSGARTPIGCFLGKL